jgi:hypothetical protein
MNDELKHFLLGVSTYLLPFVLGFVGSAIFIQWMHG